MSSNLTIYNEGKIDNMIRIAKAMKESGFFSDSTEIAQAFVKIQAGEELGFAPFAAMSGLHVIKGKPSLSANSMATLVKANPNSSPACIFTKACAKSVASEKYPLATIALATLVIWSIFPSL